MKIDVKYEETKPEKVKVSFREAGRRGGLAKVPKGFAMMSREKRSEISKKGANKRWENNGKKVL